MTELIDAMGSWPAGLDVTRRPFAGIDAARLRVAAFKAGTLQGTLFNLVLVRNEDPGAD